MEGGNCHLTLPDWGGNRSVAAIRFAAILPQSGGGWEGVV